MNHKHSLSILLILMVFSMIGRAQVTVTVQGYDNSVSTYNLAPSGSINFTNNQMIISEDNLSNSSTTLDVDQIRKVTFSDGANGIITPATDIVPILYPNPAECRITFQGIGSTPAMATLYSVSGKKLMEQLCHDGSVMDVSSLSRGLYFVRINNHTVKLAIH